MNGTRFARCLAVGLSLAASTALGQDLRHEKYRLDNGMTVILHEDRSVPVAAVNIWYGVGSKDEEPGRSGFAHLFEHLMFMGTERVPGASFDELMEAGGGSNNASTSFDRTNYYSSGPSSLLPTLLWLDADRLEDLGRTTTQEKLDLQREVVRNERRQSYENAPYGKADLALNAALFPQGHPYHESVIGSHADLEAASVEDVKAFFARFYVPSNASLVVAGDFDPEAIKPLIARLFGTLPSRPAPEHGKADPVRLDGVTRLELHDQVQLARVTSAWLTPPLYAPGDADMDVLATVLAGGKTSRLFRRLVRDEPLCADVAAWQGSRALQSVFEVAATCPPETDLARVEAIIDEEVAALARTGPSAIEIERARNAIQHAMLQRLESVADRADQMNAYEHWLGRPDALAWDLERYAAVTPRTARTWAARALPLDARVVVRVLTEDPRARPEDAAARGFAFPRPDSFTLSNGLEVHLWQRPELPLVALRLVVPGGSAGDAPLGSGQTDLALDMLDEGTAARSASEFAEALERLGSTFEPRTGRESSTIAVRTLARNLDETVALAAEALRSPAFRADDWERVRRLHLQALQQRDDDPAQVAGVVAGRRLWRDEGPYAFPIEGVQPQASAVSLEDAASRARGLVAPRGATLLVAGDVARAELEPLLERELGPWKGEASDRNRQAVPDLEGRPFEVALVHRPGAVQTVVQWRWPTPRWDDPDRVPLQVLNTVLGGSFTSRLNRNLREEHGYTYGAGSRFQHGPRAGHAMAYSQVRADVTGASLAEFVKELDRVRAGDLTQAERDKAVRTLLNRKAEEASGLDGLLDLAEEPVVNAAPLTRVDEDMRRLAEVRLEDVNALGARRVRPRDGVLVLVGDRDVVLPQLEGLDLPAPVEYLPDGWRHAPAAPPRDGRIPFQAR